MKLLNYLGLFGKWPPPATIGARSPAALGDGRDVVIGASFLRSPGPKPSRINVATVFENHHFTRQIPWDDDISGRVLCDFLNRHRGRSIHDIGHMEFTWLG